MGDLALAGAVAVLILFLVGAISFRFLKKLGVVLGAVLAVAAFLSLLGM